MSGKKKNTIVQNFRNHFLLPDWGGKVTDIKELLDLPLNAFKIVNSQEMEILTWSNFNVIRDLSLATPEQLEILTEKFNFDPTKLKKIFVASKLLYLTAQKHNPTEKSLVSKMILLGLDNAGKTTLIDMLLGKKITTLINQEPTVSVNQLNLPLQELNLVVWDFGGQASYRENYLQNPEQYFTGVDIVLFVVDVLDVNRYEEALDYFSHFLEIYKFLEESPFILVLLNKADPDISADPEFQINLEYLSGRVREILKPTKYGREIVTSSIYNGLTTQPLLVTHLKDLLKTQQITENNMILLDAMMQMIEMFTKIGNKLSESVDQLQSQNREILAQLANYQNLKTGVKPQTLTTHSPPGEISSPISSSNARPAGWPSDVPFPPPTGWSADNPVPSPLPSKPSSGMDKLSLQKKMEETVKPLQNEIMNELKDIFRRRGMVRE